MNDDEADTYLFSRLVFFTNQMKSCGDKIIKLRNVEKVLRDLTAKFDQIVVVI